MKNIAALALSTTLLVGTAWASTSPVGTWRSIDDKTQQPRSEVVITENQGVLSGKIARVLRPDADPNAVCDKCSDDRKGQPMVGLEIIRDAKPNRDNSVWEGGRILDPETGRSYNLRMMVTDQGQRLDVRGSIGPFGRTQTWIRVE
jgi:uncharacterized protein (DUF2147 family)